MGLHDGTRTEHRLCLYSPNVLGGRFLGIGSGGRDRTYDQLINSQYNYYIFQ